MFQDDRLLPWKTVLGNLLMTGNDPDKAKRLLARVGLEEYADAYPATLSGGQSIANIAALFTRGPGHPVRGAETKSCFNQSPPVLSPAPAFGHPPRSPTRSKIQELILQVCKEEGITTVLVTHDVREATIMANKIWVIKSLFPPC